MSDPWALNGNWTYSQAALHGGKSISLGGYVQRGSPAAKARMAYLRSLRGKKTAIRRANTNIKKMRGGLLLTKLGKAAYKIVKHFIDKKKKNSQASPKGGRCMSWLDYY